MNRGTTLLCVASILLGALAAHASDPPRPGLRIRDLARGTSSQAPTLDMEVSLRVTGPITRARVVQRFRNDGDSWVEGVYVFPLPHGAAVDTLRMRVGGRIFEGQIEERTRAKRRYKAARKSGQKASLVEQERPNLFTTSIANIGPGEEVEIELEYQELLAYAEGRFELHFPMALTPRYVAGHEQVSFIPASGAPGWAAPSDLVSDAHRVTPPSVAAGDSQGCLVELTVEIDAGLPLAGLESPSHPLQHTTWSGRRARIALHSVPADRDFVLRWWPEVGHEPRAAVFYEEHAGSHYVMALLLPPAPTAPKSRLTRELVLVIDTSGSMAGASLVQAQAALQHALGSLSQDDYVNVIRFDNHYDSLFPQSRPADAATLQVAARFVRSMQAHGGTEMSPALRAALADPGLPVEVRQVVFVTDGAVAGEAALFQLIEQRLGRTRLFPVGIGSAPNRHFLARAARYGRGATVAIARSSEVGARMDELLDKIEQPVLTDLQLHWNDEVEMWPERLPDVYAGEPLIVTARVPRLVGDIALVARRAEAPWQARLALPESRHEAGVAKLWARRKIASLMDARRRGFEPELMRRAIIETALAHHLVSRFTSLVTVDATPVRPQHSPLAAHALPGTLPAGSLPQTFSGVLPNTATPSPFLLYAGVMCCALSVLGLRIQRRLR